LSRPSSLLKPNETEKNKNVPKTKLRKVRNLIDISQRSKKKQMRQKNHKSGRSKVTKSKKSKYFKRNETETKSRSDSFMTKDFLVHFLNLIPHRSIMSRRNKSKKERKKKRKKERGFEKALHP
jgi:hypothetical protein